jgi:Cd2+/Zn2+-exporting ATPase
MGNKVRRELVLEGLDCANCAAKIETKVNELEGVTAAAMNFMTKTLIVETEVADRMAEIIAQTREIVKRFEPHVSVVELPTEIVNQAEGAQKGKPHNMNNAEMKEERNKEIARIAIGAVFFGVAFIFNFSSRMEFFLYLISYFVVGSEVVLRAVRNIVRGQVFDENFLMTIATIGAFAIREFPEGAAVMLFYQIGELFQDIAVNRSRKSIKALMDIRPDFANLKLGDEIKQVNPEEVEVGDTIIVKPGEKVPLDGIVIEGRSMMDTSALTGEAVPREIMGGDEVLSGFINQNGLLLVKVTKAFGESTVAKILDLVQNASSKKAPTENFITKFAKIYTPVVVLSAAAIAVIPPLVIPGATFSQWVYRALIFLVISCPCALVISIPLGFFGGIGGASKSGILVKGGNYLEALNDVRTVVFDKTGTLTKGIFKVAEIKPEKGVAERELLEAAAYAEAYSNHPIAVSILKAYGKEIYRDEIESYNEISGYGTKVHVQGKEILAGNIRLMKRESIVVDAVEALGTVVYVAIDGKYAGYIVISDEIKEDAAQAIKELRRMGVKKTVMLTGDVHYVGTKVAKQLGIDEVYSELLPDQKVEKLEMLEEENSSQKGKLVFVGDGINDAPVLARADIGIAMGGLGSDAAIEAADVVLMTDEPSKLVSAIKIAKRTRKIVMQNIVFALGVKGVVLLLGAAGMATMWEAVFADVGVAVIAIFNAMRAYKESGIRGLHPISDS